MPKLKRLTAFLLTVVLLFSLASCSKEEEVPSATAELFAMDTYMTITCYGEQAEEAAAAAKEEIQRLDSLLSVGNSESEIAELNETGTATLSEDSIAMVSKALEVYEKTEGAFDITIYPLMVEWGFTTQEFQVPEQSRIDELLSQMGSDKLTFDEQTGEITLGTGQGIDLGGIAKGYASDRLMQIFKAYDLDAGLVSLGGNVQTYKTNTDGSKWRCGVTNPTDPDGDNYLGVLHLEDQAAVTSGAYQRNFTDEKTGKTYHHIIDPSTGYSANNGLISVTVISPSGILADALSTSFYVMGLDDTIAYWQQYGEEDQFELVLMTEDNTVYVTAGIADDFDANEEYTVETIEK